VDAGMSATTATDAPPTYEIFPDLDQVQAHFLALNRPREVREVRILGYILPSGYGEPATASGYFDNAEALATALDGIGSRHATGIYITQNPVDPDLLARARNRLQRRPKHTTTDADITCLSHLTFDFDPVRKAGISATDDELAQGLAVRDAFRHFVAEDLSWPEPVVSMMSGNGGQATWRIDLPATAESRALVAAVLNAASALFSTEAVTVDTTLANPGRIVKLSGTAAAKGDPLPHRPHRQAHSEFRPEAETVSETHLRGLVALVPGPAPEPPNGRVQGAEGRAGYDVAALLEAADIGFHKRDKTWDRVDGHVRVYELDQCLSSDDHSDGAAIYQFPSGAVAYKCHHNQCANIGWRDIKHRLPIPMQHTEHGGGKRPPAPDHRAKNDRLWGNEARGYVDASSSGPRGTWSERSVADVADAPEDEGSSLLNEVADFLRRYIAYPSEHARIAHTLWVAHTHAMDAWDSTPRIAFLSPEPASGKTRGLEVTELLVPRPVETINVSAAYIFRKVDDPEGRPTILFDEIDTVFGPKAREHEDVRGLLNAGHRKGAVAGRCVVRGKTVEIEEFPAYCAVAMAGLGDLPDTILTRSVVIHMRRRAKSERVEPFRRRLAITPGHALRDRVAAWAASITPQLADGWPEMPAGVEDRDADVWEALLAVADAAGGDWPMRARGAAVALVAQSKVSTPSLGIRLLADLRTVFGDREAMTTDAVLSGLQGMPEAPWAELVGGRPLNPRGLAKRLLGYGIAPKSLRVGEKVLRGYARADLADAWERYLPPAGDADGEDHGDDARAADGEPDSPLSPSPHESATAATSATPNPEVGPNNLEMPDSDAGFRTGIGQALKTSLVATMPLLSATASTPNDAARTPVVDVADVAEVHGDGERCSVENVAPTADNDRHVPASCGALSSCRLLGPCVQYREDGRCWNDRD
jgi:hypothetical protein